MATQDTATVSLTPLVGTPDRLIKYFKVTGIMLLVTGSVMTALGVTAIGITALFSYVAVPVWSGVFIIASGILGLILYSKHFNRAVMTSFISLSAVAASLSISVVVMSIIAANWEVEYRCYPLGYDQCRGPYWSRVLVESLLALDAMFSLVVSIVAASIGGYKACACCRACCYGNYPDGDAPLIVFGANGTVVPLNFPSNTAPGTVFSLADASKGKGKTGSSPSQGQAVIIPLGTSPQGQDPQFVLAQVQAQDPQGNSNPNS